VGVEPTSPPYESGILPARRPVRIPVGPEGLEPSPAWLRARDAAATPRPRNWSRVTFSSVVQHLALLLSCRPSRLAIVSYTVTAQGLVFCATFSGCIAAPRQQEPAGYCKLRIAKCKLQIVRVAVFQFAICNCHFAICISFRTPLIAYFWVAGEARASDYPLPITFSFIRGRHERSILLPQPVLKLREQLQSVVAHDLPTDVLGVFFP
jgi:hypothetical protein